MLRCVTQLGNMQTVEQRTNSGALNPPRTATWCAKAEHTVKGYRTKSPLFLPQAKEHAMNTAITIGITVGTIISAGGCIAWYANGVKKRNKEHKAIVDEYRMILTCLLQEHNPSMFIAIREDSFGKVTAILKAHGASYNATSSFGTHDMVEQAKKANDFFKKKKLIRWVEDNPMPPEPPKEEPECAELIRLAQKVADAYTKPGIAPDYHYRKMAQLRTEWPTLSAAVCNLTGYMKEHN